MKKMKKPILKMKISNKLNELIEEDEIDDEEYLESLISDDQELI